MCSFQLSSCIINKNYLETLTPIRNVKLPLKTRESEVKFPSARNKNYLVTFEAFTPIKNIKLRIKIILRPSKLLIKNVKPSQNPRNL